MVSSKVISVVDHISLVSTCIAGTQDRASALAFDDPHLYLISNSNS